MVELNSRLNNCGLISPRFDVGVKEIKKWTARLLPSRQDSCLIDLTVGCTVYGTCCQTGCMLTMHFRTGTSNFLLFQYISSSHLTETSTALDRFIQCVGIFY